MEKFISFILTLGIGALAFYVGYTVTEKNILMGIILFVVTYLIANLFKGRN